MVRSDTDAILTLRLTPFGEFVTESAGTPHAAGILLTHGDRMGVKGGDGIIGALGPIARGAIKIGNSYRHVGVDFDFILGGHYHQLFWLPNAIFNGCVKGYDEYARLVLRAGYERPTQALFFVHPEHGITARWAVYLEGRKKAHADKVWVGWGQ